jgi:hypothetical protein
METGKKNTVCIGEAVGNHRAIGQFKIERCTDQFLRHIEELFGQRRQFGYRQTAMAVVHRFGQGIGDSGPYSDHGRLIDAKFHGDGVGRLEADAANVAGQSIRVLRHDLHGVSTVGLVDADRSR